MGQSRPLLVYFRTFLITISIIQSINGVLCTQTRGHIMVGAHDTTELWRPSNNFFYLLGEFFFRPANRWYTDVDFPEDNNASRARRKIKLEDLIVPKP